MLKIGQLKLLALGALCCSNAAWCCAPEEFAGQLIDSRVVNVAAGAAGTLVALQQYGQDLKLQLDGGSPRWIDSPSGRYGLDYAFVPAGSGSFELCLYANFRNPPTTQFTLSERTIPVGDGELLAALASLNNAGSNWADAKLKSEQATLDLYAAAANSAALARLQDPALTFSLRLSHAVMRQRNGQNAEALADLLQLAQQFSAQPHYQYQALRLAGGSQLQPANVSEGLAMLQQAMTAIDAAEAATGVDMRYDRAEIAIDLGEGQVTARNLTAAEDVLDVALKQAGADLNLLASTFANKGYLSIRRSEAAGISRADKERYQQQATEEHLLAIYFSEQAGNKAALQVNESNMAVHYARTGERRKSLVHFLRVEQLLDEVGSKSARAFLYSTLGDYSQILGDYEKAAVYLQESLSLVADPATASPRNLNLYCRLGTLYRLLGRAGEAMSSHRQCLQVAMTVNDFMSRVEGNLQLSIDAQAAGDLASASTYSEASLQWLEQAGDLNISRRAYTQKAAVLFAQQQYAPADAAIATALQLERDQRQPDDKVRALTLAMQIRQAIGDSEGALEFGRQAADLIQRLHDELEVERLGPAWSNATNAAYAVLTTLYLDQYAATGDAAMLAQALNTTEQVRDPSLRQRLQLSLSNDAASLEEQQQLALYSNIANVLASAGSTKAAPPLTPLDYFHQHDLLALARLNKVEAPPVPAPLTLAQIQQQLSPQQLALDYLLTDQALYVFTLTRSKLSVRKLERQGRLQELLTSAENLLHTPDSFSLPVLQELAGYLLPPELANVADTAELLLVSDGSLHAFPFAALPLPTSDGSYAPLVNRYRLTTVPSLSAYFMSKPARSVDYTAAVAVIADPVFDGMQVGATALAASASPDLRGWSQSLRSLENTAREAQNINSIVPGRVLLYTGNAATRANLGSAEARNAHVLHIATHGYFKSTSEDNVGLALSTIDANGKRDPGFITLTELFGYAFNNELVVISGCDTAMGKEQAGVGFNSLSRGFLAQGVKHVIATLWPVSDRGSAEFMRLFYAQLQTMHQVASALQQAQRELQRNPLYRNPYYWAGYTLTSVSPDAAITLENPLSASR